MNLSKIKNAVLSFFSAKKETAKKPVKPAVTVPLTLHDHRYLAIINENFAELRQIDAFINAGKNTQYSNLQDYYTNFAPNEKHNFDLN